MRIRTFLSRTAKHVKAVILVTIAAIASLSCQAAPPAHKPPLQFTLLAAPNGTPPITGGTIYKAHYADTNWTVYAAYTATNGTTVNVPYDPDPADLYTADSTNVLTGGTSDYCNVLTNTVLVAPGAIGN